MSDLFQFDYKANPELIPTDRKARDLARYFLERDLEGFDSMDPIQRIGVGGVFRRKHKLPKGEYIGSSDFEKALRKRFSEMNPEILSDIYRKTRESEKDYKGWHKKPARVSDDNSKEVYKGPDHISEEEIPRSKDGWPVVRDEILERFRNCVK